MIQFRRVIATLLIVSITGLALPQQAYAEMLSTDAAVAESDRDRIWSVLNRAEAEAQLKAYGVSPADAKARVAALTDEEVAPELEAIELRLAERLGARIRRG